jgi:predicted secreted hydrolase
LIVRERTDRGFDPVSAPRWRLKKSKDVYLLFIEINALDVSSGADGRCTPIEYSVLLPKIDFQVRLKSILKKSA